MPVRVQGKYDYIAHVQCNDGNVVEIEGTKDAFNKKLVYQYLLERATELDGWLLSQHINEVEEDDCPFVSDVTPKYIGVDKPAPARIEKREEPAAPSIFDDDKVFGVYYFEYKGASLCTYKETER